MPIYEYTCSACNTRFEQLHKSMNGQTKAKCPQCGSARTARALSVFAVGGESPKGTGSAAAHSPGCACCHANGTGACPMND